MDSLHPADNSPFLGNDKFVDSFIHGPDEQKPKKRIEILAAEIAKKNGVSTKAVCGVDSDRSVARARQEIISVAVGEYRHGKSAVAKYLKCDPSYVTRVIQRFSQKVKSDTGVAERRDS
jgi:hypothetical protein